MDVILSEIAALCLDELGATSARIVNHAVEARFASGVVRITPERV